MSIAEIIILALVAITFLYWMLARGRVRAAAKAKSRRDLLQRVVDPARGGVPVDQRAEHDGS